MNERIEKLMELIDAYAKESETNNEYDNRYFVQQARDAVILELKKVFYERTN